MRNNRNAGPPQRRVRVVGAAAAERVVGLGQQLEHQLVGPQAEAEEQGVVAVVGRGIVGFGEQERGGQLHGFVAPGGGVHVAGGRGFFLLVQVGHRGGGVHQAVGAAQQLLIEAGRGRRRWGGESRRCGRHGAGYAGVRRVEGFGSGGSSKFGHRGLGG